MGSGRLVGLVALRSHQRTHGNATVQNGCEAAANAVLAACEALPAADRDFVAALDAILRRQPAPVGTQPPTRAGAVLASSMLRLGQWEAAHTLALVLERFEGTAAVDDAAAAVYGWTTTSDAAVANVAMAWLARNRDAARKAVALRTADPLADECVRMARAWVSAPARPAAIEATAWLQTENAPEEDLREMLRSPNTRLVTRALCKLLLRPVASSAGLGETWKELLAMPGTQPLRLPWPDEEPTTGSHPYLLAEPVRVLTALALANQGVPLAAEGDLEALVHASCGVGLDELGRWTEARRSNGTLASVLDTIEADCRRRLGADEALRWPKLAARR